MFLLMLQVFDVFIPILCKHENYAKIHKFVRCEIRIYSGSVS